MTSTLGIYTNLSINLSIKSDVARRKTETQLQKAMSHEREISVINLDDRSRRKLKSSYRLPNHKVEKHLPVREKRTSYSFIIFTINMSITDDARYIHYYCCNKTHKYICKY